MWAFCKCFFPLIAVCFRRTISLSFQILHKTLVSAAFLFVLYWDCRECCVKTNRQFFHVTMFAVSSRVSTSAQFSSAGGSIELPLTLFTHARSTSADAIRMTVSTTSPNGLLLWQGQGPNAPRAGRDYISLLLVNGRVVFRWTSFIGCDLRNHVILLLPLLTTAFGRKSFSSQPLLVVAQNICNVAKFLLVPIPWKKLHWNCVHIGSI